MRAKEFIVEQKLSDAHDGLDIAAKSLPNTFVIDDLENQDFYDLYRFGMAIADVRGNTYDDGTNKFKPKFKAKTSWNEKQIVSSFDPGIEKVIDQALKKVHKNGKRMVSTPGSEEMDDTLTLSPIKAFKGYKR